MKKITNSEKETIDFAQEIAQKITSGKIITLDGNLGSGKTIFTKGLAKFFNIKNNINSPTFVLMKVYKIKKNKVLKNFIHVDAYRLENGDDFLNIGLGEYFNKESIVVIEWAEKLKKILPKKNIIKIELKHLKNNQREINVL